jgi:long-subunit acyl-CoA synthetase (AMP-forming)
VIDPDEEGYGELAAKGDCIFLGYLKDEEATRAAFNEDGYFLTGDIGCIRNNKVYIKGRKDAKIVLPNGEKVLVKEIEGRVKSLNENIVTVKPYVRNNQLHVDIYVKDESLINNVKLWEKLIGEFNNRATKYERIGSFEVKNSAGLLK